MVKNHLIKVENVDEIPTNCLLALRNNQCPRICISYHTKCRYYKSYPQLADMEKVC